MPAPRRILPLLLIALAINLAAALALACWGAVGPGSSAPLSKDAIPERPPPPLLWRTPMPESRPLPTSVQAAEGWGISAQMAHDPGGFVQVIRTGWPWRSLRSTLDYSLSTGAKPEPPPTNIRSGLRFRDRSLKLEMKITYKRTEGRPAGAFLTSSSRTFQAHRRIPLDPIWPGLLANTALYAASAWLLAAAFVTLRRHSRKRRGLCPHCAYQRSNLPKCPECGQ